jgi:hypothetical protein
MTYYNEENLDFEEIQEMFEDQMEDVLEEVTEGM